MNSRTVQDGPPILAVGVDLIEISRIRTMLERWGNRFLQRIYTPTEIVRYQGRVSELAARFAAKEAISKALGVGIWARTGIGWQDAEVLSDPLGKPVVHLYGRAARRATELALNHWAISLSHSNDNAIAMVAALHVE
jgi:holo-[acyl-carrier protein] synthase